MTLNLLTLIKKLVAVTNSFFWAGLWLSGIGLIAWYPMRWWPGDRFVPVQLLNYFMPWLLLGLIPALIMAAAARRHWLAVTLAIPTVVIIVNYAPLFMPRSQVVFADDGRIKVMSYNIWGNNKERETIAGVIQQQQPDLLLIQELDTDFVDAFLRDVEESYSDEKIYFTYEPVMRQGIVSRYPLTPLEGSYAQGRAQKAIIHSPAGDFEVWNVHLIQPVVWSRHYREMTRLAKAVAAEDGPLVVGGDFNTTDQTQVYKKIDRHLNNAHWDSGWGFGFSFPADRSNIKGVPVPTAVVRIDHIFYSDHFTAYNARTLSESGGSDHFPVITDLTWMR